MLPCSKRHAWIPGVLLVLLTLAHSPAHAVSRQDAANTVIGSILLPHPANGLLKAFGPLAPVQAGTSIDQGNFRSVTVVGSTSWFFWVDYSPITDFGHPTGFILVDTLTGSITMNAAGQYWPKVGGVDLYRTEASRALGSLEEIFNGGGLKPRPPVPSKSRIPTVESVLRSEVDAGSWGVIVTGEPITGGANPGRKANVDSAKAIMGGTFGVPAGNITTISPTSKADLLAKLRAIAKDCPKLYFYWTGHGSPHWFYFDSDSISDVELAHELKELHAGEYCCVLSPCFSGSFLPALRDSGITGTHVTSTDSTTFAKRWEPGQDGFVGGFFEHFWKGCLDKGLRGEAARKWADSLMTHYIDSLNAAHPGWGLPPQHPRGSQVWVFRAAGQSTQFKVPAGTATVCIYFKPGPPATCGNASLYCSTSAAGWTEYRHWNWNLGLTRYFTPAAGGGCYRLVIHSNSYPVCGDITVPTTAQPETPSSFTFVPAYSLGWADGLGSEFSIPASLGPGPGPIINVVPGLLLQSVPRYVGGGNHHDWLDVRFPLQPDGSRPWLYQGNNPGNPYTGPTTVELHFFDIWTDDFGTPAAVVPIQVSLTQGINTQFATAQAVRNPNGTVATAAVSFSPIRAQQFTIRIQPLTPVGAPRDGRPGISSASLPGAGVLGLDNVTVITATTGTLGVGEEVAAGLRFAISAPVPNPARGSVQFRASVSAPTSIALRIYDASGRLVQSIVDGAPASGDRILVWDGRTAEGSSVPAGIYFARFQAGTQIVTRKVAMVR